MSADGELFCDGDARALTWMDAIVAGRPVTPRAPLAVEISALWASANRIAARMLRRMGQEARADRLNARAAALDERFLRRFWLEDRGWLADYHTGERAVVELRPNQLIAAALPDSPLTRTQRQQILAAVDAELLTPFGLRTLAPSDSAYRGRYEGNVIQRDGAYHQGTVWPWLLGPYADTLWLVEGEAARPRLRRLLEPFTAHLDQACHGQVSEIFDGDPPHLPRGAPAQAWSVAELLRIASYAGMESS
jgi:predicted glycogen debranching enzyme